MNYETQMFKVRDRHKNQGFPSLKMDKQKSSTDIETILNNKRYNALAMEPQNSGNSINVQLNNPDFNSAQPINMQISLETEPTEGLCPSFFKQNSAMKEECDNDTTRNYDIETDELFVLNEYTIEKAEIPQEHEKSKFFPGKEKKVGRKKIYTIEDERKILELVNMYGEKNWSIIAKYMPGKDRKQLRDHYINFLKKEQRTAGFSLEEDSHVLTMVSKLGRKWQKIADTLPGRTPIMIKNRFNTKLKKILEKEKEESTGNGIEMGFKAKVAEDIEKVQKKLNEIRLN